MNSSELQACPGCGALLPAAPDPSHPYIGASGACWDIYNQLQQAGEPPLAPSSLLPLMVDAYASQHPGVPSAQAIQSVAVHLLTLQGVLERGVSPEQAMWVRLRALRGTPEARHKRFAWLEPPSFADGPNVAGIAQGLDPAARTALAEQRIRSVWSTWAARYGAVLKKWYEACVLAERLK